MLYLGTQELTVSALYVGEQPASRLYLGNTLVVSASGPPPAPKPKLAGVGDSTIAEYPTGQGIIPVPFLVSGAIPTNLAVPGHTIDQQLAVWNSQTDAARQAYDAVGVQIGLNDVSPSGSATAAIARLQNLINVIRSSIRSDAVLLVSQMIPCRQRWTDLFGPTGGAAAQQESLDINAAIAGTGPNPITNVDGRVTAHVPLLDDGNGNLAPQFETALNDHIHENNAGRQIIANAWRDALVALGLLT